MENEYSKVKVNNEMDFCSVTDTDVSIYEGERFIFPKMRKARIFLQNLRQRKTQYSILHKLRPAGNSRGSYKKLRRNGVGA